MNKLLEKFITDKNGKIILGQPPNLPIIGWFVCMVVSFILPVGFLKNGFMNLSGAFLFLWSYLEITEGVSYFRRFLGVIVLSVLVGTFFL
jgi:hypothetical protein